MFSQFLTLYVTPVFYVALERTVNFFRRQKPPRMGEAASPSESSHG